MQTEGFWDTLPARDRFRLAQALVVGLHEATVAEAISTTSGPVEELSCRLRAAMDWLAEAQGILDRRPSGGSLLRTHQAGRAREPYSRRARAIRPSVLVVDDDASSRTVLRLVLEGAGFAVTAAESAREALDSLLQNPASVDLLLTEVDMPAMAGVELLSELRARGVHLPVVFMSNGTNARAAAVAYGADGYLPKPFDVETMVRTVAELIASGQERNREARRLSMTESLNQVTIVVINSNDDLLRLLGEVGEEAGFAVVTVHTDEVGRTTEAIQAFIQRHNPKVVVYDVSPPYPPNWALFCSVRDSEQVAGTGRQFIVTTPNKAALERFVGTTAAIELVGAEEDRDLIAEAVRRAAAM